MSTRRLGKFTKQPYGRKDYDILGCRWLAPGDSFQTALVYSIACLEDPANVSLTSDAVDMTADNIKVWLTGGSAPAGAYRTYKVTVRWTTAGGRSDEGEFLMKVEDY